MYLVSLECAQVSHLLLHTKKPGSVGAVLAEKLYLGTVGLYICHSTSADQELSRYRRTS